SDVTEQEPTTEKITEVARVALSDIPTNTPEADLTDLGFVREQLTTKEGKVASIVYRRDSEDGTQVENITYQDGLGGTSNTFRTFLTRKVTPTKPLNEVSSNTDVQEQVSTSTSTRAKEIVSQTTKITDEVINKSFANNNKPIKESLENRIVKGLKDFIEDDKDNFDEVPLTEEEFNSLKLTRFKESDTYEDYYGDRNEQESLSILSKSILEDTEKVGLVKALVNASMEGDVVSLLEELNHDPTVNSYGFNESFSELIDSQLDFGQSDLFSQTNDTTTQPQEEQNDSTTPTSNDTVSSDNNV
ncbi:MAG: hypothetical protein GY920_13890, partial [Aliivibrio sp.]|nr:hypothetical protein [Aliivibrio sp.]